jgi:hypothetical protein
MRLATLINLGMSLFLLYCCALSIWHYPELWLLLIVFAVAWATEKERIDGLN